jgi:hypothetical protein
MPAEITDAELFVRLSEIADVCRVKRRGDVVKLKLRTPRKLYTLKAEPSEAEKLIKKLKCEILEV